MKSKHIILLVGLVALVWLLGCGGGNSSTPAANNPQTAVTSSTNGATPPALSSPYPQKPSGTP